MTTQRVLIIGAGLAGAATAWHLSHAHSSDLRVVLLERDAFPGNHSSGRNAGMIRQSVPRPMTRLAIESARWLRRTAGGLTTFRFEPTGSHLMGAADELDTLAEAMLDSGIDPSTVTRGTASDVGDGRVLNDGDRPVLENRQDGVIDALGLLGFFLREATTRGVELRCGADVEEIVVEGGRIRGAIVAGDLVEADTIVNAAGGWAGAVAPDGAADAGISPTARSMFHAEGPNLEFASRAFLWDVEEEWYVRRESGGWLLCAGDERPHAPGIPDPDPDMVDVLRRRLERHMPQLVNFEVKQAWAGLRTFSADRLPVIGRDPDIEGLVWMAGLGGHGVTLSHGAGAICARAILGDTTVGEDRLFDPARFSRR